MDGLFGGRADLLLGLGTFIPPQHRHVIYAKVEAATIAHQNAEISPSAGSCQRFCTCDEVGNESSRRT